MSWLHDISNLDPRAFSSFKMVGWRNLWPRLLNGSKHSWGFCHVKHDETSSFCLNNGFRLQENKTGLPDAENNLRKSHFIVCPRDKILHDSWSNLQPFSYPPFWMRRRPWEQCYISCFFSKTNEFFCNNNRELSIKISQKINKFKIINDPSQGSLDTRKVFLDMFLDKF